MPVSQANGRGREAAAVKNDNSNKGIRGADEVHVARVRKKKKSSIRNGLSEDSS